ncbi:rhodanese family protein [Aestuariivirga sp.]|uniref:rhodanese family protein n=1 Tax=Aestuariivirga sp. TaxID=2650926 RepID=UPI0039E29649
MPLRHVSPAEARQLIDQGAMLIDIRERDEHAHERIPGASSVPLSTLGETTLTGREGQVMIFHCKSGNRTRVNEDRLSQGTSCAAFILDGGLEAWRAAGLPISKDHSRPLEMNRQVQIAAGSLVVLGAALGFFVNPGFYALSAAIGAGLVFMGVTGRGWQKSAP